MFHDDGEQGVPQIQKREQKKSAPRVEEQREA